MKCKRCSKRTLIIGAVIVLLVANLNIAEWFGLVFIGINVAIIMGILALFSYLGFFSGSRKNGGSSVRHEFDDDDDDSDFDDDFDDDDDD